MRLRSRSIVAGLLLLASVASAREGAHEHGVMRLDVALDARVLSIELHAPLDSVLGFEHRPRTDAQRRAAAALRERLHDFAALLRPDAAAGCTVTRVEHSGDELWVAPQAEHADLEVSVQFDCARPAQLAGIDHGLFEAFARLQRIDVQLVDGPRQSRLTLKRPQPRLAIRR